MGPEFANVSHRLMLALVLVCSGLPASALRAASDGPLPYNVRIWQSDDGLPQNSVFALAQTRDGFLWVGTHEGLARFDGVRFVVVDEEAAPQLKRGWITALCATRDGSLWIACDGYGLTRLQRESFSHFSETNGLPSNQPRCLFEDREGSLWMGSEGGLTRYRDGEFRHFTDTNGLGDNSVRAICADRQARLQIATKRGLSSLMQDRIVGTSLVGTGAVVNALRSVCEDQQGRLWVASNDGLHSLADGQHVAYNVNDGLPDRIATVVHEDRRGQLWVGTYGGLARFAEGRVICGPKSEAVFGDLIYTVFEDAEENLWVGGRDGLYRLTPRRFATYTTQQGLTCNNVMSVCEDRSGAIWLGTWGGGVNVLEHDTIRAYGRQNGLTHDSVLALHEARDGNLWVGMDFDGGLNRLGPDRRNSFIRTSGLINAAIRVIHEDRYGTLWIGTSQGLNVLKEGAFRGYTTAEGLAGNLVMAVCEDAAGKIWLGTDGGLSRWDDGRFTNFTTQQGLSHNAINALYEDAGHDLWIATKGGLNRLKQGHFSAYTTRQGLFSDEIYEMVEDHFGHFWMSCRKGIFRVSKRDLDELDRGRLQAVTSTVFGKADGLVSVQCNGVAKPAGWKSKDGRIWFPTIRGVVALESSIKTNDQPPPVVIEEIVSGRRTLRPGVAGTANAASLTIPPGRGEVEIHYTALSFQAPEKNRFKYQLDGFDSGWIDAGTERVVRYYNLPPGRHRFRVIACNNDGVWNTAGATLAFTLQPHYWQTWWFKAGILSAVALLLTAAYRARARRLREIENLRVRIAADLHDDVGARLTRVAMMTEALDAQTPEADRIKPRLRDMFGTVRDITKAMDEIVWTINPRNDTLEHLANYIFQYAQDYFQNSGVRCRLDFPARLPDFPLSTETRHNLFMAVKEALNNALKHGRATEVRLALALTDSRLVITIADNGRGFSPDQARPSGNGLRNMKQRLDQIGGRLVLESQPGAGTTIKMEATGE